jgi:hypothetical protein
MMGVAPLSARMVLTVGSRITLMAGFVVIIAGFVTMFVLWREGTPYWQVGVAYLLVGIGVGLAATPASRSLVDSVPVRRAGMASATADLQRDLGGAVMQSAVGAVLTAGYASAISAAVASAPPAQRQLVTNEVAAQLQNSYGSATDLASRYPQYSEAIVEAAKSSFVSGANWAYGVAIAAMVGGLVLVGVFFPSRTAERDLVARYAAEDGGDPDRAAGLASAG